eukprot:1185818-Prorocentrum_minimum.AAC.2
MCRPSCGFTHLLHNALYEPTPRAVIAEGEVLAIVKGFFVVPAGLVPGGGRSRAGQGVPRVGEQIGEVLVVDLHEGGRDGLREHPRLANAAAGVAQMAQMCEELLQHQRGQTRNRVCLASPCESVVNEVPW